MLISRILMLALAPALAACAHNEHPIARRPGPVMCKEGPPAWSASDGRQIMYRAWGPLHGEPRAVVVGVPGWNGTAGDIEPLAHYLAQRNILVYSTGVRGQHGDLTAASQHTKGDIDDGRLWERDYYEFALWVRRRHPRTPLFLYGHSMGSLAVMTVSGDSASAREIRPRGIILQSPAVAMMYCPPLVRFFIGQMRRFQARKLLFNMSLIPGDRPALTNNAAFDNYWGRSADRVRPGFTWRFLDEALKSGERARIAAEKSTPPALVLTGDKDPIGTAGVGEGAFSRLMKSIPARDKKRVRFPDGYHDLIHDSNKPQALRCIGDWLERQLRVRPSA